MKNDCCSAADHMPKRAREVYGRLVEIAMREPEWQIMHTLIAWDSEISGISPRHLRLLEERGWIVRLSSMVRDDIPTNGYYVFDHEQYRILFGDECKQHE